MFSGSVLGSHRFRFGWLIKDLYLCCWIVVTSSKTSAAPEADDETEGEAKVEPEGETESEAEDEREGKTGGEAEGEVESEGETQVTEGVGGPEGEAESTNTISEAERYLTVTHRPFGAPQEGAEK